MLKRIAIYLAISLIILLSLPPLYFTYRWFYPRLGNFYSETGLFKSLSVEDVEDYINGRDVIVLARFTGESAGVNCEKLGRYTISTIEVLQVLKGDEFVKKGDVIPMKELWHYYPTNSYFRNIACEGNYRPMKKGNTYLLLLDKSKTWESLVLSSDVYAKIVFNEKVFDLNKIDKLKRKDFEVDGGSEMDDREFGIYKQSIKSFVEYFKDQIHFEEK